MGNVDCCTKRNKEERNENIQKEQIVRNSLESVNNSKQIIKKKKKHRKKSSNKKLDFFVYINLKK